MQKTQEIKQNTAKTEPKYKCTKTTVECYKLRLKEGSGYWADITIDDQGNSGRISISSDYGSWQNFWGGCGKPFKMFLQDINMEYAADKFRADEWFDYETTVREYKQSVLERRRDQGCSKETARKVWKQIGYLTDQNKESFVRQLETCQELLNFFSWTPDLRTGVSPWFKNFWEKCWTEFMKILKAESYIPVDDPSTLKRGDIIQYQDGEYTSQAHVTHVTDNEVGFADFPDEHTPYCLWSRTFEEVKSLNAVLLKNEPFIEDLEIHIVQGEIEFFEGKDYLRTICGKNRNKSIANEANTKTFTQFRTQALPPKLICKKCKFHFEKEEKRKNEQ